MIRVTDARVKAEEETMARILWEGVMPDGTTYRVVARGPNDDIVEGKGVDSLGAPAWKQVRSAETEAAVLAHALHETIKQNDRLLDKIASLHIRLQQAKSALES